eukprot:CAMPEP_0184126212 /NCGR_PEP_ID=MMETSP0974-20121125/25436_1 /TAXON_ID=483370 /ORGANISM="non described non described, Strain CCMP2097" /LENGTH=140 /DNA_ID=CAMNT_0026429573 /DNA_START=112 /DNA_END=531 /DNA_ORIENTATION=+
MPSSPLKHRRPALVGRLAVVDQRRDAAAARVWGFVAHAVAVGPVLVAEAVLYEIQRFLEGPRDDGMPRMAFVNSNALLISRFVTADAFFESQYKFADCARRSAMRPFLPKTCAPERPTLNARASISSHSFPTVQAGMNAT